MYKILFILLLLFTSSFSRTIITISHPFQEYFIKAIAKKKIYIRTVFDNGNDLDITNEKLVGKLSSSKFYFSLGLPEEESILKLFKSKNSDLKIINTTEGIGNLKLENGKPNPYIWMDPVLAREFAKKIYEELVNIRYYDRFEFKENYENLLNEIDKIFLDIKNRVDNSDTYGFFVFDNKLDYFAKRYRLDIYHKEMKRLHIDDLSEMIKFVRREQIYHIVIPKNSDYSIAQSFSNHINGKILEIDIYDKNWKINLFSLTQGLTNF